MSKRTHSTSMLLSAAAMVAIGATSWAQQPQPAATQGAREAQQAQPVAAKAPMSLRKLFAAADKDGDGRVTKAEAKGVLPITYASFDQVDTDKRGWISFEQFMAFTNKRVDKQADDILTLGDRF